MESEFGNEERLRLVARLLDGEATTDVCREFGISRKTGYKIFDRYKEHGLEAFSDRSRRPVRYAEQLPRQLETLITQLKAEKPHSPPTVRGDIPCAKCHPIVKKLTKRSFELVDARTDTLGCRSCPRAFRLFFQRCCHLGDGREPRAPPDWRKSWTQ